MNLHFSFRPNSSVRAKPLSNRPFSAGGIGSSQSLQTLKIYVPNLNPSSMCFYSSRKLFDGYLMCVWCVFDVCLMTYRVIDAYLMCVWRVFDVCLMIVCLICIWCGFYVGLMWVGVIGLCSMCAWCMCVWCVFDVFLVCVWCMFAVCLCAFSVWVWCAFSVGLCLMLDLRLSVVRFAFVCVWCIWCVFDKHSATLFHLWSQRVNTSKRSTHFKKFLKQRKGTRKNQS